MSGASPRAQCSTGLSAWYAPIDQAPLGETMEWLPRWIGVRTRESEFEASCGWASRWIDVRTARARLPINARGERLSSRPSAIPTCGVRLLRARSHSEHLEPTRLHGNLARRSQVRPLPSIQVGAFRHGDPVLRVRGSALTEHGLYLPPDE